MSSQPHMVPVSNGIVDSKHYLAMRESIWMFYYLLDKQTRGVDNDGNGKVLGGKPIRDSEIAGAYGVSERTIGRMRKRLIQNGYVTGRRTPYGYVYAIRKPKKWQEKPSERSDKGVQSLKVSDGRDRTQTVGRSDTCVRNKEDLTRPYSRSSTETPAAAVSQKQMEKQILAVWKYHQTHSRTMKVFLRLKNKRDWRSSPNFVNSDTTQLTTWRV